MDTKDFYKTLSKPSEGELFKDKNSKFYGFAFPVSNESEIVNHINALKKQHYSARHWCYAYQLGTENISYRVNDDGEPNNTAGMPIYGQIKSYELTNVLIVVIRYYGGIKLGKSGLINAYRTAADLCLLSADIVERTINLNFQLQFDYKNMSKVMRILKENDISITSQKLNEDCLLEISVRKGHGSEIHRRFNDFFGITITVL